MLGVRLVVQDRNRRNGRDRRDPRWGGRLVASAPSLSGSVGDVKEGLCVGYRRHVSRASHTNRHVVVGLSVSMQSILLLFKG